MAVPSRRAATGAGLFACTVLLAGCTDTTSTASPYPSGHYAQPARFDDLYRNRTPEVVRYDRYTLVSTRPADAQLDPLNQMVDITMPAQLVNTVGEGFRYLLLASGYSLCSATTSAFAELLSRPLPAVQRTIGPLKLSEALQVVAGPAWRLKVDEVNREVCFELRDQFRNLSAPTAVKILPTPRNVAVSGTTGVPAVTSSPVNPSATLLRDPFTGETVVTAAATRKSQSLSVPSPVIAAARPASPGKAPAVAPSGATRAASAPPSGVHKKSAPASGSMPSANPFVQASPSRPVTALPPAPPASPSTAVWSAGTPVTPSSTGETWRAEPGSTLKETLTGWASKAPCSNGGKWVVIWPVSLDYRIEAPLVMHGNFESALVQIFDLYRKAEKPLFAEANRIQCLISVSDTPAGGGH
ncbi:PFGI-1 class ICE element type IV pilus protein PilL2 [Erwinia psidii]|uniref:Pilus assembly protein PilL n=1 Tax=Erwinia psidii TaxID=69224 RepID=A0A3N6UPL5_9GAMM|nr:TcpQ domain-containing protein [Erwinia psidii]MCX8957043.1 pilus assembly protein PilL [Erwinia psidii]MCX8965301.1 pilus assembly protein PilL [Erwinia psidii]RQM37899.1 pilus assembly protein PilL [Erwinia psidii]